MRDDLIFVVNDEREATIHPVESAQFLGRMAFVLERPTPGSNFLSIFPIALNDSLIIFLLQPWFITTFLQATVLGESLPAVWAGRRNCNVLRRWRVIEDAGRIMNQL